MLKQEQMIELHYFLIRYGKLIHNKFEASTCTIGKTQTTVYTTQWYRLFNQYNFIVMIKEEEEVTVLSIGMVI